ncbi:MAG: hypothetical protein V8R81_09790 [Clostridia bacterium]
MKVTALGVGKSEALPRVGFSDEPKILHFISEQHFKALRKGRVKFDEVVVAKLIRKHKDGVLADGKTPYMIIEGNEEFIKKYFDKSVEEIINLTQKEQKEKIEKEQLKKQKEHEMRKKAAQEAEAEMKKEQLERAEAEEEEEASKE